MFTKYYLGWPSTIPELTIAFHPEVLINYLPVAAALIWASIH